MEIMVEESVILVGNDKGGTLSAFRLIDDELRLLADTEVGVGCSTFAVDTDRSLVFVAVKEPSPAIVTLRLDRETGKLAETSRRDVEDPLSYVALSGDVLLGASYHGGWGASWLVADGELSDVVSRLEYRNLHAAVPDRHGQNAYFVSLGDDLIAQFSVGADATLSELSPPTVACPPGSGPRHLVVSDDGANAYLLTEFTGEAIRFDRAADGSLTQAESLAAYSLADGLGKSAFGKDPRANRLIWGADLALVEDESWLVASERFASTITAPVIWWRAPSSRPPRSSHVGSRCRPMAVVWSCWVNCPGMRRYIGWRMARWSSSTAWRRGSAPTGFASSEAGPTLRWRPRYP